MLFVNELGKNCSGTGMDTNVIGRFYILDVGEPASPGARYLGVSNVSEAAHGNIVVRCRVRRRLPAYMPAKGLFFFQTSQPTEATHSKIIAE